MPKVISKEQFRTGSNRNDVANRSANEQECDAREEKKKEMKRKKKKRSQIEIKTKTPPSVDGSTGLLIASSQLPLQPHGSDKPYQSRQFERSTDDDTLPYVEDKTCILHYLCSVSPLKLSSCSVNPSPSRHRQHFEDFLNTIGH